LDKQVIVPTGCKTIIDSKDSSFIEILVNIYGNNYIYTRSFPEDSLPIEMGYLGLYFANHKFYLLREGLWITASGQKKTLFKHMQTDNDVEEFPESLDAVDINEKSHKKYNPRKARVRAI